MLGPTDPSSVRVAKTAIRSVFGHMNEMAFEFEHLVVSSGGLQPTDANDVNRRLLRNLRGRDGDYVVPLELAAGRSV